MADTFIASDLSYECFQKAHRETELAPPTFDQPHGRPNPVLCGRRLAELLHGLGGQEPLVHENDDRSQPHGR